MQAALAAVQAELASLKEQLAQTSKTSHRPPSSDGPDKPKRSARRKTGRKRGGQKGHKRHTRDLLPPDQVDHTHRHLPDSCRGCGAALHGTDPAPHRHQVTELPPIQPVVTEHQLHQLTCACCGTATQAKLPDEVPRGSFGPRLQALVALLTTSYRLSKQQTRQLLGDVLRIELSTGAICALEARTAQAVQGPVEQARAYVRDQTAVYVDETSWRQHNRRAWLWTAVTELVTVFVIRDNRGGKVAKELLGEDFSGTAITDRYSGYSWLSLLTHQLCWAHLLRDFAKMAAMQDPDARHIGERLLTEADTLFAFYHQWQDGHLQHSTFRTYASQLRVQIRAVLQEGKQLGHAKVSGMCASMLRTEPAMWTFARRPHVHPTNNAAERSVRHGVLMRRMSHGTQSVGGSRFVERLLTVRATLRSQGRNLFAYLEEACRAQLLGRSPPTLLPTAT